MFRFAFGPRAACVGILFASAPAFAESIENPAFQSWAAQKKGTVVTLKMASEVGGQKSESTLTYTLLELTADMATVEMVTVINVGTMEIKTPAMKTEVKKTIELPAGKKTEDFEKPDGLVDKGRRR